VIAQKFIDRMGFGSSDDRAGCRWVAVHHGLSDGGNNHIHIVVTLTTEDGRRASEHKDFPRAQELCAELEVEHGLRVDAVRDRASRSPGVSRGELRRAAAAGSGVPDRVWLRQQVRGAVAAAQGEEEWVANMRGAGLLVGVRSDPHDGERVVGYKVARPPAEGENPVWFSGRSLDGELSLDRVRQRWPAAAPLTVQQWRETRAAAPAEGVADSRVMRLRQAAAEVRAATADTGRLSPDSADVDVVARAGVDVMTQIAWISEEIGHGPVTRAADSLARAAAPQRRVVRQSPSKDAAQLARRLGSVALLLAMTGRPGNRSEVVAAVALVVAAARLAEAIRDLRAAAGRSGAASAARQAGAHLSPVLDAAGRAGVRVEDGDRPLAQPTPQERSHAERRRASDRERGRGGGDERGR
jgi:hypothetical protein